MLSSILINNIEQIPQIIDKIIYLIKQGIKDGVAYLASLLPEEKFRKMLEYLQQGFRDDISYSLVATKNENEQAVLNEEQKLVMFYLIRRGVDKVASYKITRVLKNELSLFMTLLRSGIPIQEAIDQVKPNPYIIWIDSRGFSTHPIRAYTK